MTRFEPESRCAGIWPVLAHFKTVRCFTRSSSAASDAVSHCEVITTTGSRMALLVDLMRGNEDSLIVHSSRMSGNPGSAVLRAEFGWTCWELMGLFISGIAPCVKTQPLGRSGPSVYMRACFPDPRRIDIAARNLSSRHFSKQHNGLGWQRTRGVFRCFSPYRGADFESGMGKLSHNRFRFA